MRTLHVVGIAGPSGAGKSHLAAFMAQRLGGDGGRVDCISEDDYCLSRHDLPEHLAGEPNYDHPDAIEHELLIRHLAQLRAGEPAHIPRYEHQRFLRRADTVTMQPAAVVIVEGILLFVNPRLRRCLDTRVFVNAPLDVCLHRRIVRDANHRGIAIDSTLDRYMATVRPMCLGFVLPSRVYADVVVETFGPPADFEAAAEALSARIPLTPRPVP